MSTPSKTFLTGEYAVLVGGPALILNTAPRFELTASRGATLDDVVVKGIPDGAPASVWLKQRRPLLEGWKVDFRDPHEGRGGFGASGAQFLMVHALTTLLQNSNRPALLEQGDLFNDYQVCAKGEGSGADLLAQREGGLAVVDMEKARAQVRDWPYPELGFGIVRTGHKLDTHSHLHDLKRDALNGLLVPAVNSVRSLGLESWRDFVGKVNDYERALRRLGLQAPSTTRLLEAFRHQPWCLAAKGCGAWGADTILLLFEKKNGRSAADFARAQGMPIVTDELSKGLEIMHEAH